MWCVVRLLCVNLCKYLWSCQYVPDKEHPLSISSRQIKRLCKAYIHRSLTSLLSLSLFIPFFFADLTPAKGHRNIFFPSLRCRGVWNRCWHQRHIEKHLNRVTMCHPVCIWLCAFVNTFEWLIWSPRPLYKPVRCRVTEGMFKTRWGLSHSCAHALRLLDAHGQLVD